MALANGVPILAAGQREGKNDINARIDYFRVGIDLATERPTPKQIAAGVARILSDQCFANSIARLRVELERYRPFELIDRYLAA